MNRTITELFFVAALMAACGNISVTNGNKNDKSQKTEPTHKLRIKKIDLGKILMNKNGDSEGPKTELTELRRLLPDSAIDVIEINWTWDCSEPYDDKPMKLVYNKTNEILKLVYTKNNVIEEYENIQHQCLDDFLKNGKSSFYSLESFCQNAKYDFNNREMTN